MNDTCTGCGKYTDIIHTVTVGRARSLSLTAHTMGKRAHKPVTIFVGEGLCEQCVAFVESGIRLLWERQSMNARGIK
jgi:hypothetical protein